MFHYTFLFDAYAIEVNRYIHYCHGKRMIFMLYFGVLKNIERCCLKWQGLSLGKIIIFIKNL